MLRTALVLIALLVPIVAEAAASPAPTSPAPAQARDGGMIDGRIAAVDYQKSTLSIDGGSRGRMVVTVMPSTSIQAKDPGYHTITDLRAGEHVQIFSSLAGGVYVAQIIRILP
jgi:hypothetical protein